MADAESMTPEELIKLAQEKAGGNLLHMPADAPKASPSVQHVAIDGFEVAVDVRRVTAWKTASLVAAVQNDGLGSTERLNASIELVDFLLGDSAGAVLDHLGGDMAQTEDVIDFVSKLMEKISPKA